MHDFLSRSTLLVNDAITQVYSLFAEDLMPKFNTVSKIQSGWGLRRPLAAAEGDRRHWPVGVAAPYSTDTAPHSATGR